MNFTICFIALCLSAAICSIAEPMLALGVLIAGGLIMFFIKLLDL